MYKLVTANLMLGGGGPCDGLIFFIQGGVGKKQTPSRSMLQKPRAECVRVIWPYKFLVLNVPSKKLT